MTIAWHILIRWSPNIPVAASPFEWVSWDLTNVGPTKSLTALVPGFP